MKNWKNVDLGLLILRLGLGLFMIIGHGWPKLMRFFGDEPIKFREVFGMSATMSLGMATFAEFFCSILIIVGLFTRWAAVPLAITMMVAFSVHLDDPFSRQEKSLLYLFPYISLFLMGAGQYSLDALWRKDKF